MSSCLGFPSSFPGLSSLWEVRLSWLRVVICACFTDHDKFLWLLETGDEMAAVYNCMRLNSGNTTMGVLVVCRHHLYIFDHCIVKPNGEVSIFSHDQQGSAKPPPSLEASGPVTLQGSLS